MQLNFTTHINGKPNYFAQNILDGLAVHNIITDKQYFDYVDKLFTKIDYERYFNDRYKIHTIREDKNNRFKPGINLHLVINPYQKGKRLQFAPLIKCTSTQSIIIKYCYNPKTENFDLPFILIDDKELNKQQICELALNDGFNSLQDFFAYFKTDFTGKIIHWTNFKY